jgi:hypothetical protein
MDLNAPERINDKAIEILQKRYDKVEPKFVKAVVAWIEKFKTSSGNLVRSKENISRLSTFKRAIERYLIQSGYNDMVSGFLSNFDTLAAEQQTIQSELNGLDIKKSFLNPFKRWAVNNVVAAMQGQGLTTTLINPLKQELLVAVNQGSSLTDVVTSIAGQLSTTEARQGVLKRISLQASRDALLQYDGVVNEAVRKVYKMDALLYVGSIVKDSRAQCERWVQETKNGKLGLILFEDLEDEISWAEDNGTGMIPNTTPENFCQNRGGFNCRHIAYPVRSANYVKEEETQKEPETPKEPEVKLGFDKKFDKMINDSDFVSDDAKILIDRLPKPNDIKSDEGNIGLQRSFFDSKNNEIVLAENKSSDTLLHEYGHFISNLGKGEKLSSQIDTLDDYFHQQKIFKELGVDFNSGLNYVKSITEGFDNQNFIGPIQDMFDAIYGGNAQNIAGFIGHGTEYFSIDGNIQEELFANLFQIHSSKNNEEALETIEKFFPSINNKFLEILNKL